MALTQAKKSQVIEEVTKLIGSSKLTVAARYQGTTVKAIQQLRKSAKADGTVVKVIKNRLVIKALKKNDAFSNVPTDVLNNMLIYAFNTEDEIAPAKALADFAKINTSVEFVGAYSNDGKFLDAAEVKQLASLPNKEQLRGMLVRTIAAPLTSLAVVLNGNVGGLLNVLNSRKDSLA